MLQKQLFMKSQSSREASIGLKRTRMSFQNSRVELIGLKRTRMSSQNSRVALIGLKQLRMRFQNIKSLLQTQLHQLRITSNLQVQQTKNKNQKDQMHQRLKLKVNFQQLVSKIQ